MGQSATLYRIASNDFSKVIANPEDFGLFKIAKSHETFEKTHEGLKFLLMKGQREKAAQLMEQIFDPLSFVGEQIDFSTLDFDNLPEDVDLSKEPVYYNAPAIVNEISSLLDHISVDQFQERFDHQELNEKGVYPNGVWNTYTATNAGFNLRDMTEEFLRLKAFYKNANENGDYILSYVG